jgi:hypothetical protein
MAGKKGSGSTAKKKAAVKRTSAKKAATRRKATDVNTPPAVNAARQAPAADRLTDVARTIGSRVGGIVAKTKKVLRRGERQ